MPFYQERFEANERELRRAHMAGEYFTREAEQAHVDSLLAYVQSQLKDLPKNQQIAFIRNLGHFAALVTIEFEKTYGPIFTFR